MQYMRELWQSGLEGRHIEELISSVFADFAPYAGAEQQLITVMRQHGTEASSSLVIHEEPSDVLATFTHSNVGAVSFSGAGVQSADVALRIPIGGSQSDSHPKADVDATASASAAPSRFLSSTSGCQLLSGLPRTLAGLPAYASSMGQVELEGSLLAKGFGRRVMGVRWGSLAARISSVPPATTRGSSMNPSWADNTSRIETDSGDFYQHTVEGSLCVPIGGGGRADGDAANSTAKTPRRQPWTLMLGLQHPLAAGDTLAAFAVQSDVLSSFALRHPSLRDSVDRFHPRLPLYGKPSSDQSRTESRTRFAVPDVALRFLIVQTLSRRTMGPVDSGLSSSSLFNQTIVSSEKPWYELPTLVGCNASLARGLLRLSAASIFHDGSADLETAAVLDVTPAMPSMPTLVRLGWNNTGRLAVGITTLFYDAMTLTLGVHVARGEAMRFGLEVRM